jgi:hypothetical protein
MRELPNVTVIIADTKNYSQAILAIKKTQEQIKPAKFIWCTDRIDLKVEGVEIMQFPPFAGKADYSHFMIKELNQCFETTHCLVIQHDGYVLNGDMWDDEWLEYDYIGAPWLYPDPDRNVGNGGFSLRSKRLQEALAADDYVEIIEPEDEVIGRLYRRVLEQKWDIVFAPEDIAHTFSYELHEPYSKTFGFHGYFHHPFRPIVVINRTGAMGDVIQVEPVLHYYHQKGYRVVLKTLPQFFSLFASHYFYVESFDTLNKALPYEYIDLDMSYEIKPKQLHLKSYYEMCGITDGEIRNPKLNVVVDKSNTLFPQKYVVLHIDERQPGRSAYGVNWNTVVEYLNAKGYLVIHIGKGVSEPIAGVIRMNTLAEPMLAYLLAGCDFMIGVDSGPANIAVALGKKLIAFHGSVDPDYIWPDRSNITVITNHIEEQPLCSTPYCWHSVIGCEGVECYVSKYSPPCTKFDTGQVINAINEII